MTVLVVGSVLLDVIATYEEDTPPNQIDITGVLSAYRIGGTAYNVAYNLRSLGLGVRLMTYLSSRSFATKFFRKKLHDHGLLSEFVGFHSLPIEGAFVAHRRGNIVERAVTSTVIQTIDMPTLLIERALEGVTLVIADCSLSPYQLNVFSKAATAKNIPVMILGTSDSKIPAILSAGFDMCRIFILIANKAEFRSASRESDILAKNPACFGNLKQLSKQVIIQICEALCAEHVVITLGAEGMVVLKRDGIIHIYEAPSKGEPVTSTTGAGDALSAVIAAHFTRNGGLDWDQINREIKPIVLSTLLFQGATPNCEATIEDIEFDPSHSGQ
jgi:sugar/nucleoside kinase (ribokinase family)